MIEICLRSPFRDFQMILESQLEHLSKITMIANYMILLYTFSRSQLCDNGNRCAKKLHSSTNNFEFKPYLVNLKR